MSKLDLINSKIFSRNSLATQLHQWRFFDRKIVFTNGCFDLLHLGHIDYLSKAADLGDILIVGLNSDASVQRLGKGKSRPLQNEHSRAMIMASLHVISAITIFDEDTPLELIRLIQPDVIVKGSDYDASQKDAKHSQYIVGSDVVRSKGGEVKTIPFLEGYSTSLIEKKIKES